MNHDPEGLLIGAERPNAEQPANAPYMWRRLDATLVFDSREQTGLVGVRAGRAGPPRLMYTARGMEVDLQLRPDATAGGYRLLGQILDEQFEPVSGWVVVDGANGSASADLDECGHFAIDGLAPGHHRIEAHLPEALIVVPVLHI